MPLDLWLVDAFTDRPFAATPPASASSAGNAGPVDAEPRGEMNQAETAFLLRGDDGFSLRWFTPESEGISAATPRSRAPTFFIQEGPSNPRATARFHTRSGILTAKQTDAGITLDFPATPPVPAEPPPVSSRPSDWRAGTCPRIRFLTGLPCRSDDPAVSASLPRTSPRSGHARPRRHRLLPLRYGGIEFLSRFFARRSRPRGPVTAPPTAASAPIGPQC